MSEDTVGTFKGRHLETPTDRAWIIPVVWIICCFVCFTVGAGFVYAVPRAAPSVQPLPPPPLRLLPEHRDLPARVRAAHVRWFNEDSLRSEDTATLLDVTEALRRCAQ